MKVTYENYKGVLPERLWETFKWMADRHPFTSILYTNRVLRYANADERD